MMMRTCFNLVVLVGLIVLPWYSVVLFLLAGFLYYDVYIEGVIWAIVLDLVFGAGSSQSWWYTVYAIICFASTYTLKPYLRIYA